MPLKCLRFLLPLVAVAVACEPAAGPAEFADQVFDTVDATADTLPGDATATGDPSTTMAGTWALATDWSACVAVADARFELRSYKILRVQIEQSGHQLHETRTLCSATSTQLLGQATVFPTPLLQAVGPLQVDATVIASGASTAYESSAEIQLYGVKLNQPFADPMPTDAGDPQVFDTDGDGKPGATLLIGKLCQIYVAIRAVSSLQGMWVAPGRFEGAGLHDVDQITLGGSSAFCEQSFPTYPNQPHSGFALQRVDEAGLSLDADKNGDVSCAEIVSAQAKIVTWKKADDSRCKGF